MENVHAIVMPAVELTCWGVFNGNFCHFLLHAIRAISQSAAAKLQITPIKWRRRLMIPSQFSPRKKRRFPFPGQIICQRPREAKKRKKKSTANITQQNTSESLHANNCTWIAKWKSDRSMTKTAALFDWPRETKSPLLCYRAIGGGRSVRRDVVVVVTKRVL